MAARMAQRRRLLERDQRDQCCVLVRCLPKPGGHQPQCIDAPIQLVWRVAVRQEIDAPLDVLTEELRLVDRRDRPHRPVRLLDEVPVLVEGDEELEQPSGRSPSSNPRRTASAPGSPGVSESNQRRKRSLTSRSPARSARASKSGGKPGLQRMHPQQGGAEGVDGLDAGTVHLRRPLPEAEPLLIRRRAAGSCLQGLADADPQLAGRGDGEGDRHQPLHGKPSGGDPGDDPRDHGGGLPGAGAGLDEKRSLQLGHQAIALGLVGDGWTAHASSSGISGCRARYGATAGSALLATSMESRPLAQRVL